MRRPTTPVLVLVVSLLLSVAAAWALDDTARGRDRARFENAVQSTRDRIEGRLETHVALLRGTAGLFAASDSVTREDFRAYVARLVLARRYPGVQGVGFTRRLAPDEVPAFEAQMRAGGAPGFRVWPATPRDEFHAIAYLEPQDPTNARALGFDMATEATRRAAMERARDEARPIASGRVRLVQETGPRAQAGFLLYLPVYRGGFVPATREGRRAALLGFVYAPFRADDLLAGIFGTEREPRVSFQVYDGPRADPAALLHDSRGGDAAGGREERAAFADTVRTEVEGRTWTITFASRPVLERTSARAYPPLVLAVGGVVSLVLFGLARSQAGATLRAEEAVAGLRRSLREREELAVRERAALAHAEAANRAKSRFLAVMSHELRTPLNAIAGYAELLEMGVQGAVSEGQREYLARIRSSQKHLTTLINDILDFARLEEGALEYRLSDVSVSAVVAEVEAMVTPQAVRKGLLVAREPGDRTATVYADPERLRQILLNLLTNSVKFTPAGGRVTTSWTVDAGAVRIAVRDTGIGIAPERLASIFDPFVQVEPELTRTEGGIGLGLAISRELARSMGGDVSATSEPGQGSTFTVTLPGRVGVRVGAAPRGDDGASAAGAPGGDGAR